jgi:ATP-dependent 26S proteasome regulatory subunit/N-acetylglutamate synthase-like GNAT family acetyltransferase
MAWTVRISDADDTPSIVRLLEREERGDTSHIALSQLVGDLRSPSTNVVACVGDSVVAVLIGRCEGETGRIVAIAIAPEWRNRGIGSALLEKTEAVFLKEGCRGIVALLSEGQVGSTALINRGFDVTPNLALYEKDEPMRPTAFSILEQWSGELIAPSRWESFSGLTMQRDVVEQRLLAPLIESELASQFGVVAPSAMLLFGPPGTGKTSFAKAIAGRLGWPFVELLPSKLGANGASMMADELHRAFDDLLALEHVVVFIDEVDDIASSRAARPETQAVVNELLKAMVRVRETPGRLLVCATNSIAALDPAVVRPGRFDLVIPIGPPDAESRLALLHDMLGSIPASAIEPEALVEHTDGLTPADIASAIQQAAAGVFRSVRDGQESATITNDDLIAALQATVPTISEADRSEFASESQRFSRL